MRPINDANLVVEEYASLDRLAARRSRPDGLAPRRRGLAAGAGGGCRAPAAGRARRGLRELARVLRPGGRFVGVYNRTGHMSELWGPVGHSWGEGFDAENGGALLAAVFARVTRHDCDAATLWEERASLQRYLDAFAGLTGRRLEAPDGPYPFTATRRNCVFVAER